MSLLDAVSHYYFEGSRPYLFDPVDYDYRPTESTCKDPRILKVIRASLTLNHREDRLLSGYNSDHNCRWITMNGKESYR